jgi:hypothetical protein
MSAQPKSTEQKTVLMGRSEIQKLKSALLENPIALRALARAKRNMDVGDRESAEDAIDTAIEALGNVAAVGPSHALMHASWGKTHADVAAESSEDENR